MHGQPLPTSVPLSDTKSTRRAPDSTDKPPADGCPGFAPGSRRSPGMKSPAPGSRFSWRRSRKLCLHICQAILTKQLYKRVLWNSDMGIPRGISTVRETARVTRAAPGQAGRVGRAALPRGGRARFPARFQGAPAPAGWVLGDSGVGRCNAGRSKICLEDARLRRGRGTAMIQLYGRNMRPGARQAWAPSAPAHRVERRQARRRARAEGGQHDR